MARIRTIKPEFWTGENIVECSRDARLLFIGIWNFCDDNGIHPLSIKRFKMLVFPADFDIDMDSIQRMIDDLSMNDQIHIYEYENIKYIKVIGWNKHQKIDNPTYRYPDENGYTPSSVRRHVQDKSTGDSGGREGKGKERIKEKSIKKRFPTFIPDNFKPSESNLAYAKKHNIDIGEILETFKSATASNGKQYVDWHAGLSTYLQNAKKWAVEASAKVAVNDSPKYPDFTPPDCSW